MYHHNPDARSAGRYPAEFLSLLSAQGARESQRCLASWDRLAQGATPIYNLPKLAEQLNLGAVSIKDESCRSPLKSFKVLGAPYALAQWIGRKYPDWEVQQVLAGGYRDYLATQTVISATDGNHGRALAAAAQSAGCRCVIVLHAEVSLEREQAIADYGAEIVRVDGNYDASVSEAAQLAASHDWQVISDTSYAGYEAVPRDVMQGYALIAAEVVEHIDSTGQRPYTHLVLQGGVGGLAAGVASYLWEHYGSDCPQFIVVEPRQADCLYQSALRGTPSAATGSVDSLMAGLACGEPSPLAWRVLQDAVDHFVLVEDDRAVQAMRALATGLYGDIPLVAGESGAAGLAALMAISETPSLAATIGLDRHSRLLLLNTEGATAPKIYSDCVGMDEDQVLALQQQWQS